METLPSAGAALDLARPHSIPAGNQHGGNHKLRVEPFRQWSLDARGQAVREGSGDLFPQNRVEAPVRPEEGARLGDECIVEGQNRRGCPHCSRPGGMMSGG